MGGPLMLACSDGKFLPVGIKNGNAWVVGEYAHWEVPTTKTRARWKAWLATRAIWRRGRYPRNSRNLERLRAANGWAWHTPLQVARATDRNCCGAQLENKQWQAGWPFNGLAKYMAFPHILVSPRAKSHLKAGPWDGAGLPWRYEAGPWDASKRRMLGVVYWHNSQWRWYAGQGHCYWCYWKEPNDCGYETLAEAKRSLEQHLGLAKEVASKLE